MSSIKRKLERQKAKQDGTFLYKKVLARKFGCSVPELIIVASVLLYRKAAGKTIGKKKR